MEEPYTEGVATHGDPESCVVIRKGAGVSFASPMGPPSLPATWDHLAPTSAGWRDDLGGRTVCQARGRRSPGEAASAGVPSSLGFSLLR